MVRAVVVRAVVVRVVVVRVVVVRVVVVRVNVVRFVVVRTIQGNFGEIRIQAEPIKLFYCKQDNQIETEHHLMVH